MPSHPTPPPTTPAGRCPSCRATVGGEHSPVCDVYAQVITGRPRNAQGIWAVVQAGDVGLAACGCSAVLVAGHGTTGRGHRPTCRRQSWITPVDPPTDEHAHPSWAAAYADDTLSRHLIGPPDTTCTTMVTGFVFWDHAAHWLDHHTPPGARPLGVFAIRSLHRERLHAEALADNCAHA